jgi:limonene 1,2-monooxygenase
LGPMNDAVLEHHVANWHIYEEECRKHGHVADRSKWRITLMMHVAETREQAMADAAWGIREFNDYTHDVVPAPPGIPRDTADLVGAALEKQVAIIGTPDDAIREIERVRQKLGGFGAVLVFGNDLAPWPAQLRSFELIAEFVKPHFSRANALRRASYAKTAAAIGEYRQEAGAASASASDAYQSKQRG